MEVRGNVGRTLSDLVSVEKGVKQDDNPARILFAPCFSNSFRIAFETFVEGVHIRYWTAGRHFIQLQKTLCQNERSSYLHH